MSRSGFCWRLFARSVGLSDRAPNPTSSDPDTSLIGDCIAVTWQLSDLLDGIGKTSNAHSIEFEFLMASQRQVDAQLLTLVDRVASTRASTRCGIQWKHAVANLLMSLDRDNNPSPYRDALLLSFLRDVERLRYPVIANRNAPSVADAAAARAVIKNGQTCLKVMDEFTAGLTQWEQSDNLSPNAQKKLTASLSSLLRQKRELIARLAKSPAHSVTAMKAKKMVLQRLLEFGTSDTHELRVDLAKSYLDDLGEYIRVNGRGQEPITETGSL